MKRGLALGTALLFLSTLPVSAQIVFDGSLLQALVGHQVQNSVYLMNAQHYASLGGLLNATGPGQTYDFTPYTYGFPSQVTYDALPSAAGTPGAGDPLFSQATYVQAQAGGDGFYAYFELNADGFFLLGSIFVQGTDIDGNGVLDQTIQKNDPPDPTYRFPITEGSAWNQTYVSTTEGFGVTSQVSTTVDFAVEGWGTLLTPAGNAPALRLRKTLTQHGDGGYTTTSYLFITNETLGASIILDSQGTVLSASYNDDGSGPTHVEELPQRAFRLESNYPNPFSQSTTLAFTLLNPGHAALRVFDLMGREVARLVDRQLPAGTHRAVFETDGISSGVYLARLEVDGTAAVRPLVVRK